MTQSNKTNLYSSSNEDKTCIYTPVENSNDQLHQGINVGDIVTIRNSTFTVQSLISSGTGEANVYKITDTTGKAFALKLYFEFRFADEEPNSIALERIKALNDADILKLYDYGIGSDKYLGKYCYEISEYAQGGNLLQVENFKQKYTADFIEKEIVQQIFLAITKLHEYKIYHCDLKPQNILYLDAAQTDLVIGDYGSAKAYDLQSEKDLRRSKIVKGTEAYLAPEQARGITSEKNDYYSFGMILLHLLYPEQLCDDNNYGLIDRDKFAGIVERQYGAEPIINFEPQYKKLNQLIGGLTKAYHSNRWGNEEVTGWLKGEVNLMNENTESKSESEALKAGNARIHSITELAVYIAENDRFFDELIEDDDTFTALKTWLIQNKDVPFKSNFVSLVIYFRDSGKKYLREALLRFMQPEMPILVNQEKYELWEQADPHNYDRIILNLIKAINAITDIEEKRFYQFQLEFVLRQVSIFNGIEPIKEIAKANLKLIYHKLGIHYDFPEKLITLTTHYKKQIPENQSQKTSAKKQTSNLKGQISDSQYDKKNEGTTEQARTSETNYEFEKFNSKINIIESEGNGIKFYGHYSTEAAYNYQKAWYCYFFYNSNESDRFKSYDTLAHIKTILTDKALDFKTIDNYAIHTHNKNASRIQINHAAFSSHDWLNQSVWGYVDVNKDMAFYFENGLTTPLNASNLNLIKDPKTLLTLFVIYPLKHQLHPVPLKVEQKVEKTLQAKVTEFKQFKISQYFGNDELQPVTQVIDECFAESPLSIEQLNQGLHRCTVEEALLSYYLFLKYSRDDNIHKISPAFSLETYKSNINKLVYENDVGFDSKLIQQVLDKEFKTIKTKCDEYCNQYHCKGYWYARKNHSLKDGKIVDVATIYNNEIYSVFEFVPNGKVSKSFIKLLGIYNQFSSIRSFGIYNIETKNWYMFGDYYYKYHGAYYLEMKNKFEIKR